MWRILKLKAELYITRLEIRVIQARMQRDSIIRERQMNAQAFLNQQVPMPEGISDVFRESLESAVKHKIDMRL